MTLTDQIICAVADGPPLGLTSNRIAEIVGCTKRQARGACNRLFDCRKLDRMKIHDIGKGKNTMMYLYRRGNGRQI